MSLRDIVNVVITRQTTPVSRAGFGTLLVVGEHTLFADRVRYYTDLDALIDDGFVTSDLIYKAVAKAFAQPVRPVRVGVGKKVSAEDWPTTMAAIKNANNDWYGLVAVSHTPADVLAIAGWVETQTKLYGTSTEDPDTLDGAEVGDIGYQLKALGYARTFVMFSEDADDTFPEAAWLGRQLPKDPGTETWKFKTLAGVTPSPLTDSQALAAKGKNVNVYTTIGGVNITQEGMVASGEFIDIIHGVDWLQARMTENIFSRMVNLPKIPFTDAGIAIVEAEIRGQLERGVSVGFLAAETTNGEGKVVPGYTITVPKAGDVPANDKANRVLNDVSFDAVLAGAIHSLSIAGVVRV